MGEIDGKFSRINKLSATLLNISRVYEIENAKGKSEISTKMN
jgi:hypothetical protein